STPLRGGRALRIERSAWNQARARRASWLASCVSPGDANGRIRRSSMLGLVLTAGGARGAYQAGVLRRVAGVRSLRGRPSPFSIVTGASAGAINGMLLAARSRDFEAGGRDLAELWAHLSVSDVFRCDPASLARATLRWVRDLALGGLFGGGSV